LQHLFAADLSGLIHDDDRAARIMERCVRKALTVCAPMKSVAFQIGDLLALWCEDLDDLDQL
jgi:hypothetical protein